MCRTVNINDEIIVVSHGEEDTGKMAMLGAGGKFHKSVIPVIDDLQEQITKEVTERTEADKQLQNNIDSEINARKDADNQLQANIDAEVDARTKADQDLQDKLDVEIVARTKGDETEASERDSADKNLQEQIDLLKGNNAFAKVVVGDATIEADKQTDTIELEAGTNIALTADTINDKVTIAVTGKVASAQQADTATKLETARNINGVAFDGTKDIAITTGVPVGFIGLWSGSINTIPENWVLCNGENNTPDLRDRFVLGAGKSYSVGTAGGEPTHTLTVDEMPSHNHPIGWYQASGSRDDGSTAGGGGVVTEKIDEGWNNGSSGDIKVEVNGGSQAHNNMPPYYALAYVMRIV
jgi:microcystin-dependent protein